MLRKKFLHMTIFGFAAFVAGYAPLANATVPTYTGATTPPEKLFNMNARAPEISSVPALSNLVKSGAKLYYLGERSGMHGWFIIKSGQIQMIYLSPDKQSVVVGAMFSSEGENVTSPQITVLSKNNTEVHQLLNGSAEQHKEIVKAGDPGGAASVPSDPASVAASTAPNNLPGAPLSPGERLVQDLKASASVILGKADGAELMMVSAPGCPNCKKTWLELRDSVRNGKIQVRLIPVYNSVGGDEKKVAAQILRAENPMAAWDRFVEGDVSALAGEPDDVALRAIQSNLALVAKWNIQGYPYLVYRGRDGRIKIVQGTPQRMATVLADLVSGP